MLSISDTAPIRPGEDLDWRAAEAYLRHHIPSDCISEPDRRSALRVEQFPGGHSNLTYLLRFGAREFVLRRPPFGPVAPTAHDMPREFRVLSLVHPVFPPAPSLHRIERGAEDAGKTRGVCRAPDPRLGGEVGARPNERGPGDGGAHALAPGPDSRTLGRRAPLRPAADLALD